MNSEDSMRFDKAVILGATGPTGIHLARALRREGVQVRVVSRKLENLKQRFDSEEYECFPADAIRVDDVARAIDDYPVVFDCIGLPADLMQQHPVTARNIVGATKKTGARCVQISSYWSYLPIVRLPLTEDHPRTGGNEWIEHRRVAEDVLQEAGAAIVHLPDFYGPYVHTSTLQQPLRDATQGKAMNWIGSPDTEREYVFVPDAMALAARLATHRQAYGERWVFPGAGPLSGRQVALIASRHLDREVKLRSAGLLTLRVLGLFNRPLRGFLKMVPHYLKPISYDASKIKRLLGEAVATPYEQAIGETLSWLSG